MAKSNRTHQFPPIVENLGDGSFYYNFNVVTSETEEGAPQYHYEQVRCKFPVVKEKIQECVNQENYDHQVDITGYEEV